MYRNVANISFSVSHNGTKSCSRQKSILLTNYPRDIQVAILKVELHKLADSLVAEFEDAPQKNIGRITGHFVKERKHDRKM